MSTLSDWAFHQLTAAYAGTGGMLALYPRWDYADQLIVPGGDPAEDLHCTLVYLGDDARALPVPTLANLAESIADLFSVIPARVMGHAQFNPDGFEEREPAAVYLIGDSPELTNMRDRLLEVVRPPINIPDQHDPFIAHVTAGFNIPAESLIYTGDILFDRLALAVGGQVQFFPLAGA